MPTSREPTLESEPRCSIVVDGVCAGYGGVRVLHDVSLSVATGDIVALLGTNGHGKSTLIKCIMGIIRPTAGRVLINVAERAYDVAALSTEDLVNLGVTLVPEGRRLFPTLTVEENLKLGAYRKIARARIKETMALCFELFPV